MVGHRRLDLPGDGHVAVAARARAPASVNRATRASRSLATLDRSTTVTAKPSPAGRAAMAPPMPPAAPVMIADAAQVTRNQAGNRR